MKLLKKSEVLSENAKGWRKELNLISWNEGSPKYDIREWAPGHEKMGKGTTLTKEEVLKLKEIFNTLIYTEANPGDMFSSVGFCAKK